LDVLSAIPEVTDAGTLRAPHLWQVLEQKRAVEGVAANPNYLAISICQRKRLELRLRATPLPTCLQALARSPIPQNRAVLTEETKLLTR
jgi:hypothetical protein